MAQQTIVVALGGNALIRRTDPMTADVQRNNIRVAAKALAPIALENRLVLAHGNGPQVGLLALQAEAYAHEVEPYPLDVLVAKTQGMIAYMIEQELSNVLPLDFPIATVLTMIEVDPDDPAFDGPTKFVGPQYTPEEAEALAAEKGWRFKLDGDKPRRVVPSPAPKQIFEIEPIRWLVEKGALVIAAGGGGIPTVFHPDDSSTLMGAEAVIDKDLASELLAQNLDADLFVMVTDSDGIYLDWGTPEQRLLTCTTPDELDRYGFAEGSMGPKVEAAARFVRMTGNRAVIGSLDQIEGMVAGTAGTSVVPAYAGE